MSAKLSSILALIAGATAHPIAQGQDAANKAGWFDTDDHKSFISSLSASPTVSGASETPPPSASTVVTVEGNSTHTANRTDATNGTLTNTTMPLNGTDCGKKGKGHEKAKGKGHAKHGDDAGDESDKAKRDEELVDFYKRNEKNRWETLITNHNGTEDKNGVAAADTAIPMESGNFAGDGANGTDAALTSNCPNATDSANATNSANTTNTHLAEEDEEEEDCDECEDEDEDEESGSWFSNLFGGGKDKGHGSKVGGENSTMPANGTFPGNGSCGNVTLPGNGTFPGNDTNATGIASASAEPTPSAALYARHLYAGIKRQDPAANRADTPAESPSASPSEAPAESPSASPSEAPAESPSASPSDASASPSTAGSETWTADYTAATSNSTRYDEGWGPGGRVENGNSTDSNSSNVDSGKPAGGWMGSGGDFPPAHGKKLKDEKEGKDEKDGKKDKDSKKDKDGKKHGKGNKAKCEEEGEESASPSASPSDSASPSPSPSAETEGSSPATPVVTGSGSAVSGSSAFSSSSGSISVLPISSTSGDVPAASASPSADASIAAPY